MVQKQRLIALDVMRGATIAGMILVNMPGSWDYVLPFLEHADWHGLTPPDFIFPFFLFMVGVAMAFSLDRQISENADQAGMRIAKRSLALILTGWLLHAFPFFNFSDYLAGKGDLIFTLPHSRIPGVLQRIGLCYGVVGAAMLFLRNRGLVILAITSMVSYHLILLIGGDYTIKGNLVGQIDTAIFGVQHLWDKKNSFDPEGLLSSLPALATAIFGVLAGRLLRNGQPLREQLAQLRSWGFIFVLFGAFWALSLPVNKNLWTSSYVLVTSGAAYIVLSSLIWLIDIKGFRGAWIKPFQYFGSNALLAYILAEGWTLIMMRILVLPNGKGALEDGYSGAFDLVFKYIGTPLLGSLLFAVLNVILIGLVLRGLFKKGIYFKL